MLKVEIKEGVSVKEFFPNEKHIINYAFTIGDRHYFRFDDPLNTGYSRALASLVYYTELDMNCDRAFLKAHTEAVDNIMMKGKFTIDDLITIKTLNNQLKQRLELPPENALMYKMAAIVFFDQFENPQTYEFKYGENKIKYWKKNTELTDFFLQKPVVELMPYLKHAKENLKQFSAMTEKATQQHLDNLFPLLSEEQRMTYQGKSKLSPAL